MGYYAKMHEKQLGRMYYPDDGAESSHYNNIEILVLRFNYLS